MFSSMGPSINKKPRSPYLTSSIVFAVSSVVSFAMSIYSCLTDGFSAVNITSLVANGLYSVGYILYVKAEIYSESQESGALPLLNSLPMVQHHTNR